jgi:hypothetical protein
MATRAQYTNYLAQRLHHYQTYDLKDAALWTAFRRDFHNWTEEIFALCNPAPTYMLREVLLHNGVWIATGENTFCRALFNTLREREPTRWTRSELFEYVYSSGYINSDSLVYYLRENYPSSLQFRKEPIPVLQLIHYEDYHFPFPRSKPPTPGTSTVVKGLTDRSPAPKVHPASTSKARLATKTTEPITGLTKYPKQVEPTCPPSESLHPLREEKEGHREEQGTITAVGRRHRKRKIQSEFLAKQMIRRAKCVPQKQPPSPKTQPLRWRKASLPPRT